MLKKWKIVGEDTGYFFGKILYIFFMGKKEKL